MEPMTLGSPGGSPAANPSPYLPAFLMGDSQIPTTPRNTLSPNKGTRNLSFASPIQNSPASTPFGEHQRFSTNQKQLFNNSVNANYSGTQGPPTQGLFDSLRSERNLIETPTRGIQSPLGFGTPIAGVQNNLSGVGGGNISFQQQHILQQQQQFPPHSTTIYNDSSYLTNNSYNTSRCLTSPLGGPLGTPNTNGIVNNASYMLQCPSTPRYTEFWITVYGFPPSAISTILQHFAQCGTIVDKVFPPQNGNWVHLKYASRLECDKALSYNEKILGNNIMIGVTQCKDKNIIDKENMCESIVQSCKVRPLAQSAYKSAQNDSAVVNNGNLPQKSSGLMNKAMDLFFGW
ncbi:nucleoporin Nup35 [Eurosta solidaginis]|uniref:nucleoporin Nup35 n=1 Tax=Eurosta solidaginis TaxID=178769 RepID=UPI0035313D75